MPGGESTTVIKLLERFGLDAPIVERVRAGMPFWGTCMGMIVAAHDVAGSGQPTLGLLDITVRRNAFGRQIASAEVDLAIPVLGRRRSRRSSFARRGSSAPARGSSARERDGHGVFVRQGNVLGSSFHPELTGDDRLTAISSTWLRQQGNSPAVTPSDDGVRRTAPLASRAKSRDRGNRRLILRAR